MSSVVYSSIMYNLVHSTYGIALADKCTYDVTDVSFVVLEVSSRC